MKEVSSLCYFGFINTPTVLYPSWLLQAEGVKKIYEGQSEFAERYITEDLQMELKNPGPGTLITLNMEESEICRPLKKNFTVPEDQTGEMLTLQVPVEWDYSTLLTWDTDKMVRLAWNVSLNGKEVERYTQNFVCRSLRCYDTHIVVTDPDLTARIEQTDIGAFPVKKSDHGTYIYTTDFVAGYVDENSPLIDRLKDEVLDDGYLSLLSGGAYFNEEELLDNVRAFTFAMMKYRIAYTYRDAGTIQYVRSIDEMFANSQGFCLDIPIAFASWCVNLGIDCTLESVPDHTCNRIFSQETAYPIDMQVLAAYLEFYDKFATPPSDEDFKTTTWLYNSCMDVNIPTNENYDKEREAGNPQYHTTHINQLRKYLPSFNIGERYVDTRVAAPASRSIRLLKAGA